MNTIQYLNHVIKHHVQNAAEYRRQAEVLPKNTEFKLHMAMLHDISAEASVKKLNSIFETYKEPQNEN